MPETNQITGDNLLGSRPSRIGSSDFTAHDRTSEEVLSGRFSLATMEEIDAAGELAHRAFLEWKPTSPARRASFLRAIADNIEALGDALLERASAETALPIPRLTGERARTTGQLRMFADLIEEGSWVQASVDHAIPDRQPLPKPDIRRMQIPLGPIVVFGASNFPFAYSVAGGDTASALAAGCPVIVKAHPAHPGTSELVARAILSAAEKTGMPDGVFSMVHTDNSGAIALVQHDAMEGVGFTGSLTGGRALFDAAAARSRPIPVFAEMGSVNPVFITRGALNSRLDKIADGYVQSLTLGGGQFCTNPGIVFGVLSEDWKSFWALVQHKLSSIAAVPMLTDAIAETYRKSVSKLLDRPGVNHWRHSTYVECSPIFMTCGYSTYESDPDLQHEVFGPFGLGVGCASMEELIVAAKDLEGQLTASIHFVDGEDVSELISILQTKVGRIVFNGFPTGVEVCPSMVHGGPYPASTDSRFSAVGNSAIARWTRPVCFQNCPDELLPEELKESNPRRIWRTVDGALAAP